MKKNKRTFWIFTYAFFILNIFTGKIQEMFNKHFYPAALIIKKMLNFLNHRPSLVIVLLLFLSVSAYANRVIIEENIQTWANEGSYGNYDRATTVYTYDDSYTDTVSMDSCIISSGASATGVGSEGRIQMEAANGIVELPETKKTIKARFHLAAGAADRTVWLQEWNGASWVNIVQFTGINTTGEAREYEFDSAATRVLRLAEPSHALYVHDIIIIGPDIKINFPLNDHDTNVSPITVSGTSAYSYTGDSVQLYVNGVQHGTNYHLLADSGSWDFSGVNLTSGANYLNVRLISGGTDIAQDTITVGYYPDNPLIEIQSPTTSGVSYETQVLSITVSGTTVFTAGRNGDTMEIFVSSTSYGGKAITAANGSWEISGVELNPGENKVWVELTDQFGRKAYDTITVTVDYLWENFEDDVSNVYADTQHNLRTGTWTSNDEASIFDNDVNDKKNGSSAVRIRDSGGYIQSPEWSGTIYGISFYHARYSSHASSTLELSYSTNGGADWTLIDTISNDSLELTLYSKAINVTDAMFRITKTTANSANIDDFKALFVEPSVDISLPADNHDTTVQTITVKGSTANSISGDSVRILVNGIQSGDTYGITSSDESWTITDVNLTGYGDSVVAEFTDRIGVKRYDTITVNYFGTLSVAITLPEDNHDTTVSSITVSGTTANIKGVLGDTIEIFVNSISYGGAAIDELNASWSFSGINLTGAGDKIWVELTDQFGRKAYDTITVNLRNSTIYITNPDDLSETQAPIINIKGYISGLGSIGDSIQIKNNGVVIGTTTVAADSTWYFNDIYIADSYENEIAAELYEGSVSDTFVHSDTIMIYADTGVEITYPSDGATISTRNTSVSGTGGGVPIGSTVRITAPNVPTVYGEILSDYTWSVPQFSLVTGSNTILAELFYGTTSDTLVATHTITVTLEAGAGPAIGTKNLIADSIVISEASLYYTVLYNPTKEDIDLSSYWVVITYTKGSDWHDIYLPDNRLAQMDNAHDNFTEINSSVIKSGGFYKIGIGSQDLSDTDGVILNGSVSVPGSIGLFTFDPQTKSGEEAKEQRTDALGWRGTAAAGTPDNVYETLWKGGYVESTHAPTATISLHRKSGVAISGAAFIDSDNNDTDFIRGSDQKIGANSSFDTIIPVFILSADTSTVKEGANFTLSGTLAVQTASGIQSDSIVTDYTGDSAYAEITISLGSISRSTTPSFTSGVSGNFSCSITSAPAGTVTIWFSDGAAVGSTQITILQLAEVSTLDAASVDTQIATLNAEIDTGSFDDAEIRFAYKKTADGVWSYTDWSAVNDTSYSEGLTGLTSNTNYHFYAEIKFDGETESDTGGLRTFTTLKVDPTITTDTASNITSDSADLSGTYTVGDYSVWVYSQYRILNSGHAWVDTMKLNKDSSGTYAQNVSGLTSDTTYEFRAALDYDGTTIYGDTKTFYVPPAEENTPPEVEILVPIDGETYSQNVSCTFVLKDGESDSIDILIEYSADGGASWHIAAITGDTTGLSSSPSGETHSVIWNSLIDIGDGVETNTVQIRITPYDGIDSGAADTTADFGVDNLGPPVPSNVSSIAIVSGADTGVYITWDAVTAYDLAGYYVYRDTMAMYGSAGAVKISALLTDTTGYLDNTPVQGDSYFYYITSVDSYSNESAHSDSTYAANVTAYKYTGGVTLNGNPSNPVPGSTILWHIEILNNGFGPADNITVTDTLPSYSAYKENSADTLDSAYNASITYSSDGVNFDDTQTGATHIKFQMLQAVDPSSSSYSFKLKLEGYIK